VRDAKIKAELTLPGSPENPGATIAKTVFISPLSTYSARIFSTLFTILFVYSIEEPSGAFTDTINNPLSSEGASSFGRNWNSNNDINIKMMVIV
jgi:hypothetical protein